MIEPLQIARGMPGERWKVRHGFGTKATHSRALGRASVGRMTTASTPFGAARVVEELSLPQQAGGKTFSSLVQLLETERGEQLVRFAYATGGTARRGPVTLRTRDLERLRAALSEHPALKEVLMPS